MTLPINQSQTSPRLLRTDMMRALIADAHPGGLFPGLALPPTWFSANVPRVAIPSALPEPGDLPGIFQAVIEMCTAIRKEGLAAFAAGAHPVLVGGDHSLAMGSLAAATGHLGRVAVVWIDAHADFNTLATSPSGNPHGMPLAAACGLGDERLTGMFKQHVQTQDVVLIGARDIDPEEEKLMAAHGIWHVTVPQLREMGIASLVSAVAERFDGIPVHLSFDFDSISEEFFPATGTPVGQGLTPDEASALLAGLGQSGLSFCSSDWVEYHATHEDAPACGELARRMFDTFYGKRG